MLKISNLKVKTEDKLVLAGVDLDVKKGEIVVLFGPNGSGKSSLLKTLMGLSGYKVVSGEVKLEGKDILDKTIDERKKMGINLMYQKPPVINGVKLETITGKLGDEKKPGSWEKDLNVSKFMNRDINKNLSGGEIKRTELAQMIFGDGKLYLLDEPDSGVDVDNVVILGKTINNLITKEKSAIVVTHSGQILKYIKASRAYIMMQGRIYCQGEADDIYNTISKIGYRACVDCLCRGGKKYAVK